MLAAAALWLAQGCGRTTPRDLFGSAQSLWDDERVTDGERDTAPPQRDAAPRSDAGSHDAGEEAGALPACLKNADCEDDSVCIAEQCVYFGQCLLDSHCGGNRTCMDNQCSDEPFTPGGSIGCQINADCPEHFYCVGGRCELGVECLKHAHCPAEEACLGGICYSAVE